MPTDLPSPLPPFLTRADDKLRTALAILETGMGDLTGKEQDRLHVLLRDARAALADSRADYAPEHARPEPDAAVAELAQALRLTAEYAMLPPLAGWSWYDALSRHCPAELEGYPPYKAPAPAPEPVATEREWLGKVRGLIERNWLAGSPARELALQALEEARDDLAGQDVMFQDGYDRGRESVLSSVSYQAAQRAYDAAERAEPVEPAPATIEVLPLPDDRFLLVLSSWPHPMSVDAGTQLRDQTGAAAVLAVPHPVYLPDGIRSGVNAAMLAADAIRPRR